MAALRKAQICCRSPAEIMGSNPAGGMDVCLFWVLRVVTYRSLWRPDHSSKGVLTVVRRYVWSRNLKNEKAIVRVGPQHQKKKKSLRNNIDYELMQMRNTTSVATFTLSYTIVAWSIQKKGFWQVTQFPACLFMLSLFIQGWLSYHVHSFCWADLPVRFHDVQ